LHGHGRERKWEERDNGDEEKEKGGHGLRELSGSMKRGEGVHKSLREIERERGVM
jgi:hypothetical protein